MACVHLFLQKGDLPIARVSDFPTFFLDKVSLLKVD